MSKSVSAAHSATQTQAPEAPGPDRIVLVSRCAWTMFNFRKHLIGELLARGDEVTALGAGGDGYEQRVRDLGAHFESIPLSFRGIRVTDDMRLLIDLVRRFKTLKPQVAHFFTIKPAIYGTVAAAIAGVPVRVVMVTGLGFAFTSARWPLRYAVMTLYAFALRFAHRVYFQNPHDRDEFLRRRLVKADKVRMIAGSGVDLETFTPSPPRPTAGPLTFVMVARLLREKGVHEFFAAAEAVRRRHPSTRFVLVGGTDSRNPTSITDEEARRAAACSGVTLAGQVEDVRPFLAEADVVVLPSYREGTPMSLLEAAAMAKPIVATDVPGCREVVAHGVNGFLVAPRDAGALAEAIKTCVKERSRLPAMGDAGRTLVADRYDVRLVCRQILADYDALWRSRSLP